MKKVFSKVYLGLIFLFLYAPLIVMVLISFNSGDSTTQIEGFSLKWYREIFRDHGTLQAFRNTLVLSVLAAVLATVIGTLAAVGIHKMRSKRLRSAVMTVTNIPMMNPDIVTGISLMLLFVFAARMLNLETTLSFYTLLIAHITFCRSCGRWIRTCPKPPRIWAARRCSPSSRWSCPSSCPPSGRP